LFIREGYEYDCIFDWTIKQDTLNQIPASISSPINNTTSSMAVESATIYPPTAGSDKDEKQKGKEPERKGLKIFRSKDKEKRSSGSPTRDADDKMEEKDNKDPFIKRFFFLTKSGKKKQEEETKKKKGGSGKE